jgi:hypothetical protein
LVRRIGEDEGKTKTVEDGEGCWADAVDTWEREGWIGKIGGWTFVGSGQGEKMDGLP